MKNSPELANIYYISLPVSAGTSVNGFDFDPAILLPVEFLPGQNTQPEDISWEMIISAILRVLTVNPSHEKADYFRGLVQSLRPQIIEELTQAGIAKTNVNDLPMAEELFAAAVGLEPDNPAARLNLALIFESRIENFETLGRQEQAEEYRQKAFAAFNEAVKFGETEPEIFYRAAFFYLQVENFTKAGECFSNYVRTGDDQTKLENAKTVLSEMGASSQRDQMFREAYDQISMGREDDGIRKISAYLEGDPAAWNGWFLLGWGHRRQARYEYALDAFRKADKLNPDHIDTLNEMAICYMETDKLDDALEVLAQAVKIDPNNVKILSNLGILYLKEGQDSEALRWFLKAQEIDPEDPVVCGFINQIDQ
jgi:tetratricopeptide (TPR) repeat protein